MIEPLEASTARADISQDKKSGRCPAETLGDIRAKGLLADSIHLQVPEQMSQLIRPLEINLFLKPGRLS